MQNKILMLYNLLVLATVDLEIFKEKYEYIKKKKAKISIVLTCIQKFCDTGEVRK